MCSVASAECLNPTGGRRGAESRLQTEIPRNSDPGPVCVPHRSSSWLDFLTVFSLMRKLYRTGPCVNKGLRLCRC